MLDLVISEFGRRMGMPDLALDANGRIGLRVEGLGDLHLERSEGQPDIVHIYLSRPAPPHDRALVQRALEVCHYRHAHPFTLATAVHKDHCLVLARVEVGSITAPQLEQIIIHLAKCMDIIFRGD